MKQASCSVAVQVYQEQQGTRAVRAQGVSGNSVLSS